MTRTRNLRRALVVIAGLAAASVTLSACLFSPIVPQPIPTKTPSADGVAANVASFYTQTLSWSSCGTGFDCTSVTAPLDWQNPEAGTITLAVIRHRATNGTALGSLLTNPGGPGASGYDLIQQSLDYAVGSELQKTFDVIGFDPRGVGRSTAVTCYDAKQMDSYLFDLVPAPRGSATWTSDLVASQKAFGAACEQNSSGLLPYITTDQAARDMDLLRGVLGDKKLNYLGYSYGTFLGATYAKLFPQNVGRMVLDGALDPSVSGLDVSTTQAIGFQSALRAYMTNCLAGSSCPFTGTVDHALASLGDLLAQVDKTPITNADGRKLGADSLVTGIVAALYSKDSWPVLSSALAAVKSGSAAQAFRLVDFYYNRSSNGVYQDNSTEAFEAYNCMDYPQVTSQALKDASKAEIAAKAPTIAPYWSGPDPCAVWPITATGVREKISAPGAPPIIVIGTTNDPATPYVWAKSLAEQLSSGVLITHEGEGHTAFNKGSSCVDDAVVTYFETGTPPQNGLTCQ
jgi:pimeloyl-ACP methyl ester carboxylesterase